MIDDDVQCFRGYTGPGGLSEDSRYENCTGGAAGYIDVMVLGKHHIYQYPTPSVSSSCSKNITSANIQLLVNFVAIGRILHPPTPSVSHRFIKNSHLPILTP